nr:ImmA/IrrE family metallo-endopeptidase [Actinomyces denticolens]
MPSFSRWNGHDWIICLNCRQPAPRSRLALLHEFKHIIDYGHTRRLYTGTARCSAAQQAEQAADHFAAYTLVPPRALQRAWRRGIRHPAALARHFQVPTATILIRLVQSRLAARDDAPSAVAAHTPSGYATPPGTAYQHHSMRRSH